MCGLGTIKHAEFAFASGEMSQAQFTAFLTETLGNMSRVMHDGAIAFVCMDWRHMGELLAASGASFTQLKNVLVWNKTIGGMGAFYRSKHKLAFVFKRGTAAHANSFGLGETRHYRTNVWDYPGISSIGANRAEELAMHPTVKPVALIADAIRDCSRRGEVVLDGFGGSGSTLIAAEKTARAARLVEYDPGTGGHTGPRGQPGTHRARRPRFGGYSFYLRDGLPRFHYNAIGERQYLVRDPRARRGRARDQGAVRHRQSGTRFSGHVDPVRRWQRGRLHDRVQPVHGQVGRGNR